MVDVSLQTAENYFNMIVVAVVILLVGLALGILVKKLLYRFLKDLEFNKTGRKWEIPLDLEKVVSSLASYIIYLITVILFLDQLEIRSIVITLVVVGLLLLFLLTFLVGAKNVYHNLKGWLKVRKDPKVKVGKRLKFGEIEGIIEKVKIQETFLKTERGDILRIPNSMWNNDKK
jgi:small-conductance mechanosensitive channel